MSGSSYARLQIGDVLESSWGGGRRYVVVGFTSRGKLIYRRESGTEDTAWWTWRTDLPKHMRVANR